jgi:hypothetical protein
VRDSPSDKAVIYALWQ